MTSPLSLIRKFVRRAFLVCLCVFFIPLFVAFVLNQITIYFHRPLHDRLQNWFFRLAVWQLLVALNFLAGKKTHFTLSGDRPRSDESFVLLSNHDTYFDFLYQALALRYCGVVGGARWVTRADVAKIPVFGWVRSLV